jgi:rhodanese-related sulfurtransferase
MRFLAIGLLAALAGAQAADTSLAQPKDLAAQLQAKGAQPALIHVGFAVLYRGKHIPNSIYAGPANTPAGLQALRAAVATLPHDREIVVYCGCCPWDHCPNIKPAMEALKQMGFTRTKALNIPTNLAVDWFDHGYPAELGEAAKPAK